MWLEFGVWKGQTLQLISNYTNNNVYGFDRVLTIMKKCCIRDESQLENKIKKHIKKVEPEKDNKTEKK